MKVVTCFFVVLAVQAVSSSIFDEFENAVDTVKETFSSLLGTVITDVKETIDCTIFAVEQLLLTTDSIDFEKRCRGTSDVPDENQIPVTYEDSIDGLKPPDSQPNTPRENTIEFKLKAYNNNYNNVTIEIHTQINKSISHLNHTISKFMSAEEIHTRFEIIRVSLKSETQKLSEVNMYLQEKLDKLSTDIKDKLHNRNIVSNCSLLEHIWSNLQVLHEAEPLEMNKDAKLKQIENVINEILAIVLKNVSDTVPVNDEMKINDLIEQLYVDVNSALHSSLITASQEPTNVINPVIDMENNLILTSETQPEYTQKTEFIGNNENELKSTNNIKSVNKEVTNVEPVQTYEEQNVFSDYSDDYDSSFYGLPSVPLAQTAEAKNIINTYKESKAIMDKYFNNSNNVVEDPFSVNANYDNDYQNDYDDPLSTLFN